MRKKEVVRDSEITCVSEVFPFVAVRSQYEVGSCKIELKGHSNHGSK
jgi:hypothetical protein